MTIYDLDDTQLFIALDQCQQFLSTRHDSGVSYTQLASEINVKESALKQFIKRRPENGAPLRRGHVFDQIYRFVTRVDADKFSDQSGDTYRPAKILSDYQKTAIYGGLMSALAIDEQATLECAKKVFSRTKYYCIRNDEDRDFVIISEIRFNSISAKGRMPVWEFTHYDSDIDGSEKKSDGLTLVMHKTIYLMGDIQHGEGLDIFLIREPMGFSKYLFGFLVSSDDDHVPFFSNIVLVDSSIIDIDSEQVVGREADHNSSHDEFAGVMHKDKLRIYPVAGHRSFGEQILQQLAISSSDGVLRIKKRNIIVK